MEAAVQRNTRLLREAREGAGPAAEELVSLTYDSLRELAASFMKRERAGHSLQATALVHEAYLRLIDQEHAGWRDREHFLAVAAVLMRRILVDHARGKAALKRGGHLQRVPLEDSLAIKGANLDVIALDEALGRLRESDERKARVVELRYFGGLSIAEVARALGIAEPTAEKDWYIARAWLHRELNGEGAERS